MVLNAKLRRTGICGAAECLLIDRPVATTLGAEAIRDLLDAGVRERIARSGERRSWDTE